MYKVNRKYHFIYKTTNLLSGRYYIGMHSTDNLDDGYLGSGKRLGRAIKKHGRENFIREILEFCSSREELISKEKDIVNLNEISKEKCMNLMVGGEGGYPYHENLEGQRNFALSGNEAFRNKLKDEYYSLNFKKKTGEITSRMKKGFLKNPLDWTGRSHSEETKKRMSESSKETGTGETNSQYGTYWITNGKENKKIKKDEFIPEGYYKGRKIK